MRPVVPGSTDQSVYFYASATLTSASTGIAATYTRYSNGRPAQAAQSISLSDLGSATASHTDGGLIVVDAGSGLHRLDLPDAACAAGADHVVVSVGATNVIVAAEQLDLATGKRLSDIEADTTVIGAAGAGLTSLGDTRLANLDATVSSRLADADYTAPANSSIASILADTNELQTDWADGGRLDLILDSAASFAASILSTLSTKLAGITSLAKWLGILAGKTADAGTLAEVNATTAGAGYDNTTDSQEAIRDTEPLGTAMRGTDSAYTGTPPTANENADALLDRADAIETGWTLRKLLRIVGAVLGGKVSGAGTGTETFKAIDDSKTRVTATVDASGNRTNVDKDST